jgi:hypothetical protein
MTIRIIFDKDIFIILHCDFPQNYEKLRRELNRRATLFLN